MITILTEPSFNQPYLTKKRLKNFIKKYLLKKPTPKFAGHYAVVRSLLNGLDQIDYNYNYNPTNKSEISSHVHVLAGVNTLKSAIKLKKNGKIKRLTAGPNIVVSSADENGLIGAKEIDKYFVNSNWTVNAYTLDNPLLRDKIGIWAAGVDEKQWDIEKIKPHKPTALFYKKRPEHNIYEHCKEKALEEGYEIIEIIPGTFSHKEFKEALKKSTIVIYFVEQESQGIALQEIWATNTPTYVWNPKIWMYKNINYECCSAPYLNEKTGAFFENKLSFNQLIKQPIINFEPQKWVLENMTDKICAREFVNVTK